MKKILTLNDEGVKDLNGRFTLIGDVIVSDSSFGIDVVNEKGTWKYNRANIGVSISDKNKVFCENMAGFSVGDRKPFPLYLRSGDFMQSFEVAFADRHDIVNGKENDYGLSMADIANNYKFKVGIERDTEGKIVVKEFLHEYDMIKYLKEHLENGMRVKIVGDIEYNYFNNNISQRRIFKSVFLAREDEDNKAEQEADMYITKDSLIDKDDDKLRGYGVHRFTKINGKEVKSKYVNKKGEIKEVNSKRYPLPIELTIGVSEDKREKMEKYMTVPKDKEDRVYQISLLSDIIEEDEEIELDESSLGEDFEFFELMDEEQLNNKSALNGNRIRKIVAKNVNVIMKNDDNGKRIPTLRREDCYDYEEFLKELQEFNEFSFTSDEPEVNNEEEKIEKSDFVSDGELSINDFLNGEEDIPF